MQVNEQQNSYQQQQDDYPQVQRTVYGNMNNFQGSIQGQLPQFSNDYQARPGYPPVVAKNEQFPVPNNFKGNFQKEDGFISQKKPLKSN